MTTKNLLMPLLAVCGLALTATAQDSTSIHNGLPGDAPDAYSADAQCASYVLDLATITTSWGTEFTLGPLLKSARAEPGTFFNNLNSSYGISAIYANSSFTGQSYPVWNAQGFGVSGSDNNASGTSVTPSGNAVQFAAVLSDFSGASENILGAVIRIDPANPTRLYVDRSIAATNGLNNAESRAAFGVGAVNEQGQIAFRADSNATTGPNAITNQNIFVVNLLNRNCSVVNLIDLDGGADSGATLDILRNNSVTHSTPSILPASVRDNTIFGANFNREIRFGDENSTSTTTVHRTGTSDHRGTTGFSAVSWFPGSAGLGTVMSRPSDVGPGNLTIGISYWGIDPVTGGVLGNSASNTGLLTLPAAAEVGQAITDNFDNYSIGLPADPQSLWEWTHYFSQTGFRGGNGRIAANTDANGNLLFAVVAADTSINGRANSPVNSITVARVSPTGAVEWTIAAWTDLLGPNGGKAITDGQGNTIGHLAEIGQISTIAGPSITTPAIDSAGNVWFVAPARFFEPGGEVQTTGLFRAVYDANTFSYEVESVVRVSDIAQGINSDTNYRINFVNIANGSGNSINSGAFTSNSLIQQQWLGGSQTLAKGDPRALGGLVFGAEIIYDINGDGDFVSAVDDPASPDEQYQVLMFVGVNAEGSGPADCLGDIADDFGFTVNEGGGPDGVVDFGDFVALLGLIGPCSGGTPGCLGDIADDFGFTANEGGGPDGVVDFGDFVALLGLIGPCP